MRIPAQFLLTGAAALVAAVAVQAAPITWSPAENTGGKADLIEGNVLIALNGGPSGTTITGGGAGGTTTYTFVASNFTELGAHSLSAAAGGPDPRMRTSENIYAPETLSSSGDADFDTLISSVTDSWGTPAGITDATLTLNGLVDGEAYIIQVFFNDQRATSDTRVMSYGDGLGNTVDLVGGDSTAGVQADHYGQYAIGTFTASGTTQDLSMRANAFGNIHFNALLVTGPPGANFPPEFEMVSYLFEIFDGALLGSAVGSVTATDPDLGPDPLLYTITEGNGDGAFAIDPATGDLTVAGLIDIEVELTYTLTVDAFDGAAHTDTIVWVDVYDAPAPPVTVAFSSSVLDEPQWHSMGFGGVGYLFANSDDNDEAAGNYKRGGAIYTSNETPTGEQTIQFSLLATSNSLWDKHGAVPGTLLTAALNADLENPDEDAETFKVGDLTTVALGDNGFTDSFSLTFDEAIPGGLRIGILVGAKEVQGLEGTIDGTTGGLRDVPYQLQVGTVITTTTQTALATPSAPLWLTESPTDPNEGLPQADWYFFELTDIVAGSAVTISAARIYSQFSHKFNPVNGVVLASLTPTVATPEITGVSRSGDLLTIDFTGEAGVTDWKVMAGIDLLSFPIDETPASIPENPTGVYQAQIDVSGDPASYFMRIER